MRGWRSVVALVLAAAVVAIPAIVGGPRRVAVTGRRLIIITPHNERIRLEFARAFDAWHREHHGEPATIVWSVPGGTSEILRMLQGQFEAALEAGDPLGGSADLFWGGGTWVHEQLKKPITVSVGGVERSTTISVGAGFDPAWLAGVYGENDIGGLPLYDEQQHWFGTAVSGFGIVFNRDALGKLGLEDPDSWDDLCDPALRRWMAMVNPSQSGSVATLYETILSQRGWAEGWRILRRAGANSRSFSAGSRRAPIDVGLGEAAASICIDFYGRYQAQIIDDVAGTRRLGYVDPAGETLIDPDPMSPLRGAPDLELARRFIEFSLTERGQALWQFRPGAPDGLGPERFELRRLPILRSMYEKHLDRFVDRVNAYELASVPRHRNPHTRKMIGPLFGAMVIDTHEKLREAWSAIADHPAYPTDPGIVTAADVSDPMLAEMLELFDAMPEAPGPDGAPLPLDADEHLERIVAALDEPALWPAEGEPAAITQVRFARFFERRYERIVELGREAGGP